MKDRKVKQLASLFLSFCVMCSIVSTLIIPSSASNTGNVILEIPWVEINNCGNQYEPTGHKKACQAYSFAYCRIILDKKSHKWTEYRAKGSEYMAAKFSSAGYNNEHSLSKQTVLKAVYDNINIGRPVILNVVSKNTSGHYVVAIGYSSECNPEALTENDIIIINPSNKGIIKKAGSKENYTYLGPEYSLKCNKANNNLYQYGTAKSGGVSTTSGSASQGSDTGTSQPFPPTTYVTITFDPNGGSVSPSTQKIVKGSDPTNLPKPIRKGYTFKGWILDKIDPDNPPLNSSSGMITEDSAWGFSKDTTIYAYWVKDTISEKKFTVTLDDGSTCKQITVTSGGTYSGLTNPSKDGYTFDGWYTAKMGGTKITSSTKVNLTGDQTLYAHWIKISVEENPSEPERPVTAPPHNHSGPFKYSESSHPHLNHYICSTCGADYTDGSTSPDKKCDQCWGPWSVWSYTPAYSSETRQVECQHTETQVEVAKGYTEYRYGGYATSDGKHECWCDTYLRSKFGSANLRYSDWSTTRYRENGKGWSCGQCSGNHIHVGHYDGNGNAWWPEYTLPGGKNYYWEETRTVPAQYETRIETVYRYRDWTHG